LFTLGLWSNTRLAGAVAITVALQVAAVYIPFLQRLFRTQALDAGEWAMILSLCLILMAALEFEKWLVRSGRLYRMAAEVQTRN
jgi:Ca2+-transporting ATPase